jgi:hypothetical protein
LAEYLTPFKSRKSIHLNTFRASLLIFCFSVTSKVAFAQDVLAKIAAFNEAIGKEYNLSAKGKTLEVQGFREGKQVKIDKVNVFDLDMETIRFIEEDKAVSVKCYSDLDGCVSQVLTQDTRKSYRKRLVFGLADGISGTEVESKLRALLKDMTKK